MKKQSTKSHSVPSTKTLRSESLPQIPHLTENGGAVRFEVRVRPRASKSRVIGVRDEVLDLAIAAPPVDGAANAEVIHLLCDLFDVGRSSIEIVRGATGRQKLVKVIGMTLVEVQQKLATAIDAG